MIDYNIGWVPASQFRIDTVTYEIRGPIHGKNLPIEWVPTGAGIGCDKCGGSPGNCQLVVNKRALIRLCSSCWDKCYDAYIDEEEAKPWYAPLPRKDPSAYFVQKWIDGKLDPRADITQCQPKPTDKDLAVQFWARFFAKVRGITSSSSSCCRTSEDPSRTGS